MRKLVLLGLVSLFVLSATPANAVDGYWVDQLGLRQAWQLSEGAGVRVGLIDTGVTAQAELAGAVLPGADFPDLGAPPGDAIGHGTTMALLIAGVAPKAGILPAKLTGGPADAVAAVRWTVDNGAKVVNISLGAAGGETGYDEAITYAREHDVVVVAAAGNAPRDTKVTSPADRPGVLAVSAIDRAGQFSSEVSVSGPAVSFAAPGVDITTSRPGEKAPTSGTSQAAALVSGVVALIRSRFPRLSADQVTEQLAKTAKDLGAPGRDPLYGFGLVDPVAALTADIDDTDWWSIALWAGAGLALTSLVIWRAHRLTRKPLRPPMGRLAPSRWP